MSSSCIDSSQYNITLSWPDDPVYTCVKPLVILFVVYMCFSVLGLYVKEQTCLEMILSAVWFLPDHVDFAGVWAGSAQSTASIARPKIPSRMTLAL